MNNLRTMVQKFVWIHEHLLPKLINFSDLVLFKTYKLLSFLPFSNPVISKLQRFLSNRKSLNHKSITLFSCCINFYIAAKIVLARHQFVLLQHSDKCCYVCLKCSYCHLMVNQICTHGSFQYSLPRILNT